jgi:hypothetical protein
MKLQPLDIYFLGKYIVFATLSKPMGDFLMKLVARNITMCGCAYFLGNVVPQFFKEPRPLGLDFLMSIFYAKNFSLYKLIQTLHQYADVSCFGSMVLCP